MRHPMVRTFIIAVALMFALTMHAAAQKKVTVEQALAQLHGLCEQDYKPACMKLGFVVERISSREAKKLRASHPEWFWWERW